MFKDLTHKNFTFVPPPPHCFRQVAGQSVALPSFCVITGVQEHNVSATFDRRNFCIVNPRIVNANYKRAKRALIVLYRNQ